MALFTLGGLDKLIAPIKQSCVYHAASSGSLSSSSRFLGPSPCIQTPGCVLDSIPIKLQRVFLSFSAVPAHQHILCTDEYFTMTCAQDSYRIVPCFMQVVTHDKEICYLRTVIVTANVCGDISTRWSHISSKI